MTWPSASASGPRLASARPTASTASTWRLRRRPSLIVSRSRWSACSSDEIVRRVPTTSMIVTEARTSPRWTAVSMCSPVISAGTR